MSLPFSRKQGLSWHAVKKAQTVMSDLFLASMILIILLAAIMFVRANYEQRINENVQNDVLVSQAIRISDVLVKTPGEPMNWENESGTPDVLGIASGDRVLSSDKVEAMFALNYPVLQQLTGTSNINITLKTVDGSVIHSTSINESTTISVRIERRVVYDGGVALLYIELWDK